MKSKAGMFAKYDSHPENLLLSGFHLGELWRMHFPNINSGKREILATVLLLALLVSALTGTVLIKLATCLLPSTSKYIPKVNLQSPENKIYGENSVPVDFSVSFFSWANHTNELRLEYSLDYSTLMPLAGFHQSISEGFAVIGSTLTHLSEGVHVLRVQVTVFYEDIRDTSIQSWSPPGLSEAVSFTVNAAVPRVSILSLKQLKTYNATTLPLEFAVSEPTASLSYSLDGGALVSIAGNTSLSGLSDGKHTIMVQAEDLAGSVGESSVTFTVETAGTEQPDGSQPAPFPTTLVAVVVIASVAAVSFGLVAYFLRRRKRS